MDSTRRSYFLRLYLLIIDFLLMLALLQFSVRWYSEQWKQVRSILYVVSLSILMESIL